MTIDPYWEAGVTFNISTQTDFNQHYNRHEIGWMLY